MNSQHCSCQECKLRPYSSMYHSRFMSSCSMDQFSQAFQQILIKNWFLIWIFLVVSYSDCASNKKGVFLESSCSFLIVSVIVALNRSVWRFLGRILKIVCSWSPKLSSSSRSASSRTSIWILFKVKSVPLSMWSARRPGVAISICGLLASCLACSVISIPPVITQSRILKENCVTSDKLVWKKRIQYLHLLACRWFWTGRQFGRQVPLSVWGRVRKCHRDPRLAFEWWAEQRRLSCPSLSWHRLWCPRPPGSSGCNDVAQALALSSF